MAARTNKVGLHLPNDVSRQIQRESRRLRRNKGWLIAYAWRLARERIGELPPYDAETLGVEQPEGFSLSAHL